MNESPRPGPIGLIAGAGRLPVIVARGMRAAGHDVHAVGLGGACDDALRAHCATYRPVGIARPKSWLRILRARGVDRAVMVGRVEKARAHDPLRLLRLLPDGLALSIWYRRLRHDRRNSALLGALADALAARGVTLIDSTTHIHDQMATMGPMGRVRPSDAQTADVAFGRSVLRTVAEADIGQAIAVSERDVIAVEAVEGTAAMIERAGTLCRRRWTLLKSSRDEHDRRADVPTIGVETVEQVARAGGGAIALGAGRVIMIDRDEVVAAADRLGIALVGFDATPPDDAGDQSSAVDPPTRP